MADPENGAALGVVSSSIQSLYDAMGRKDATGFTVPAIISDPDYEVARRFPCSIEKFGRPVIFESPVPK